MPSSMSELDHCILGRFKCPFVKCKHKLEPEKCSFSHLDGSEALPTYVCVFHLQGQCKKPSRSYCNIGVHLSAVDLLDLANFAALNVMLISEFYAGDENRECAICYELVLNKPNFAHRRFALLENCYHCFCEGCLKSWRSNRCTLCPVCQVNSPRIKVHSRFLMDERKAQLFHGSHSTPLLA